MYTHWPLAIEKLKISLAKSCTHCVERLIEVDSVDNVNNHLWNSVTCLLLLLLVSTQKFCHPEIPTKYATPVFFSQSCMIMVCMVFPATCVFIIIFSHVFWFIFCYQTRRGWDISTV